MSAVQTEILDKIGSMTVLELSELIKAMEEKFDVSAAAAVAVAGPAAGAAPAAAAEEQTEFTVVLALVRREQGQRHQGRSRTDGPRPQGSEGPGRRRAEAGEGRREQGRRRSRQEEAGRSRRKGRSQVDESAGVASLTAATLGNFDAQWRSRSWSERKSRAEPDDFGLEMLGEGWRIAAPLRSLRRSKQSRSPPALLRFPSRLRKAGLVGRRCNGDVVRQRLVVASHQPGNATFPDSRG